ncbi:MULTISPECIES: phosphoribosyltransferase [Sulfurovum]|uniref:Phosphoribosyltransferase family protein n=1 Tax=Sulfurovum xiamenensis TaxID=3019066 RepID=A0ABT7QSZ7_9BACT|nr:MULTISPECIES: phosphoribosyltransferase family protein [Sulfurovum]EIF50145.1 putative nucleotide phosphoribosyltransferase [Sulfurovum sp. AR]MDM5264213.1 phosphoribosyltransferase family protein [Sulfurovum xiamenensis]
MEKRYYPYEDFLADTRSLAQMIDWEFDTIIPIARGGLSLGHLLGEFYDIREVYSINTIGYEDTLKLDSVKVFNIPELTEAKNVLVVDDIVDSGDTMIEVLKVLHKAYPAVNFKTASLFYKKSAKIAPDWSVQEADRWIEFFWSVDLTRKK